MKIENELLNPCLSFTHLPSICFMCLKESYGQESSDSSDEEWSAFSTPRKTRLQDNEKASLTESLRSAKRCSRREAAREQNNEHTQSEQLHGSASEPQTREQLHGSPSEQQTVVLHSNVSSGKAAKYHFGPIVSQVHDTSFLLV
jgi:remodeling and spacing factor 1